jgi:hypothetical protein
VVFYNWCFMFLCWLIFWMLFSTWEKREIDHQLIFKDDKLMSEELKKSHSFKLTFTFSAIDLRVSSLPAI